MSEIVAGVAEATSAERILDRALLEAESTGFPLRVLTAWSMPLPSGDITGMSLAVMPTPKDVAKVAGDQADTLLAKALAARTSEVPIITRTTAVNDAPGAALIAASETADLIVVGSRGHGAVASVLLGSATLHVLHRSSCPVMVVPASAAPGPYRRVVVAVDTSPSSTAAVTWGLHAAERHHCPLVLVHAIAMTPSPVTISPNTLFPDFAKATTTWLEQLLPSLELDPGAVPVSVKVLEGTAAGALLEEAGPDDLLVTGTRGRGGFATLILGSVAMQCAQYTEGVLVVVRSEVSS